MPVVTAEEVERTISAFTRLDQRGDKKAMNKLAQRLQKEQPFLLQHAAAVRVTWEEMGPSKVTSVLREPHFSFRVQRETEQILASMGVANPAQAVLTGGYRITTTLDYPLQQTAKEQVSKWVTALANKNVHNGALVAINSANGEIVAYVGSVDYYNRADLRVQGQFDVAGLGLRQPGSAFKPITYSSAFRARRATPATFFVDAVTQYGSSNPKSAYIPTNAGIKEHGPLLAMDALRYSLNVPSVMMQNLVGVEVTAQFAESMGVASAGYILGEDPGLTLTLGSVPINLTNLTQAYGVFGEGGTLHRATTVIQIRDRDGNVIYDAADDAPPATQPMTEAEAYLTHWILESNTNPKLNLLWGKRAALYDPAGTRRHAGFKTGTTNDYRDVSGFGYVPGSLVTGVWMGNNNQEPMSNRFGQGLFSADGPLYLWHDFMQLALNKPWDWNGGAPTPNDDIAQPAGVVMASVCRFSGMSPTSACGATIKSPFLEGTVPPPGRRGAGRRDVLRHRGRTRTGRAGARGDRGRPTLGRPLRERRAGAEGEPGPDRRAGPRERVAPDRPDPGQHRLRRPDLRLRAGHPHAGADAGAVGRRWRRWRRGSGRLPARQPEVHADARRASRRPRPAGRRSERADARALRRPRRPRRRAPPRPRRPIGRSSPTPTPGQLRLPGSLRTRLTTARPPRDGRPLLVCAAIGVRESAGVEVDPDPGPRRWRG